MLRAIAKVSRLVADVTVGLFVDIFRLTELVSLTDAAAKLVSKILGDAAGAADTTTLAVGKGVSDDSTAGEEVLKSVSKPITDGSAVTDGGVLGNQDYASNYFSEDYVGESRTIT